MSSNQRYSVRRGIDRRRKRKNNIIAGLIFAAIFIAALILVINLASAGGKKKDDKSEDSKVASESTAQESKGGDNKDGDKKDSSAGKDSNSEEKGDVISQAEALAVQYDYDGAIELLEKAEASETNAEISSKIEELKAKKEKLVATTPQNVTHVFFHSLIVDPERGFSTTGNSSWDRLTPGFCQWMTTVSEFDKMMEQMYEGGYVLVSLYDMVDIEKTPDGTEHITGKSIYLPEGKTPFVMSVDDVSYYHSYDGRGAASKMIIGENGKPTCEYIDADGKTLVGSYDVIPRLDDFLEKHPDFSYKGAKGTIALTGYNGILGYRTDFCYRDKNEDDLLEDQIAWLKDNPDFDWEKECEEAKKVAQCIKDDGWTFANHTWGHVRIGDSDMERIQTDTGKWLERVAPLVGDTDIIIFAHGQDLASWDEEYSETEKFKYLKSKGFSIYCNVDGSKYFVQIGDEYLRMGRRNLDGLRLWQAVYGGKDYLSDLFDPATVIDPKRPTDSSLYQ